MNTKLGRVIILVNDYNKAFEFYEKIFSCHKIFDEAGPQGQRYLHVGFSNDDKVGVWFLKADTSVQQLLVGNQTGGQPTLVIYTDDIEELYRHAQANQVNITEPLVSNRDS